MLDSVRKWMDVVATLAITVVAGVLIWKIVSSPQPTAGSPSTSRVGYQVGQIIDSAGDIDFSRAPATLLMFLRSSCKYCTESMPFYRQLAAEPSRARLIVAGSETPDKLSEYLREHNLVVDELKKVTPVDWKVTGTPTLLLVGADRKVRGVWMGRLDEPRQAAVVAAIRLN